MKRRLKCSSALNNPSFLRGTEHRASVTVPQIPGRCIFLNVSLETDHFYRFLFLYCSSLCDLLVIEPIVVGCLRLVPKAMRILPTSTSVLRPCKRSQRRLENKAVVLFTAWYLFVLLFSSLSISANSSATILLCTATLSTTTPSMTTHLYWAGNPSKESYKHLLTDL